MITKGENIYLLYLQDPKRNRHYLKRKRKRKRKKRNKDKKRSSLQMYSKFHELSNINNCYVDNKNLVEAEVYILWNYDHITIKNEDQEDCYLQQQNLPEALAIYSKYVRFTCPICLNENSDKDLIMLHCGHGICISCYQMDNFDKLFCAICRCNNPQVLKGIGSSQ